MPQPDHPPDIARALAEAINDYGVAPLDDPARATAVVADLVADPHRSSAADIVALRCALEAVTSQQVTATRGRLDVTAAVASATASGVAPDLADRTVRLVATELDLETDEGAGGGGVWDGYLRWLVPAVAIAAVAIIAVVLVVAPWNGDDGTAAESSGDEVEGDDSGPDADETREPDTDGSGTDESATDGEEGQPPEEPSPVVVEPTGFTATFAPVREGAFLVERGWRVTPSQTEVIGIVRLSSPDGVATFGNHRELPPPGAVPGPEGLSWTPEPTALVNTTAVYNGIAVGAGEFVEFEFRAGLDPATPLTEADIVAWFEEWRPLAEGLRSALGEADALLAPVVEVITDE